MTRYESAIRTLAALHSVDLNKVGLTSFGRVGDFYKRQIARMGSTTKAQVIPGKVDALPYADQLLKWYSENLPPDRSSLVHGDYKLDNLIFHSTDSRVIGVLDWEMSTIGHPLSDLANFSLPYYGDDSTPPPLGGISNLVNTEYGKLVVMF